MDVNAGRVSAHTPAGSGAETYVLDPAGNVTQVYTRRGHILESTYDAAGQLVRSVVPQVSYPTIQCRNHAQCQLWSFPTRDARPGVCIAADTARFRYDAAGRITAADNMYARVRRSYTPSGLMTTEQLAVRTYYRSAALNPCGEEAPEPQTTIPSLDWDFAQNVYTSTRAYDLEGRRTSLTHPLAGGTQQYTYNANTGLPSVVTGITGDLTRLDHDDALRRWRTRYPGGVNEEMVFDSAGRVVQRTAASIGETVVRDAAGRVYEATVTPATGGSFAAVIRYNGLGAVVRATGVVPGTSLEEMDVDAIGNRHIHRVSGEIANNADRYRRSRYDSTGRLDSLWTGATDPKPFSGYDFREHYLHDASGNVHHVWGQEVQCVGACVIETEAVSYYSADEKLRVFNRQIGQGTSAPGGVYEEYRYDALGRRVLVRSRSTAPCATPACSSYIERVAWDGAQRLMEVRAPGKDNESSTNLNSDQAVGLATDNFPFGRVRYTHGPGLDRPLAIIRENLQGHPTIVVAPHANWQGDYEVGTFMNGTLTTTCTGSSGCPIIGWPGHHTTADGEPVAGAPPGWYGGIISQSADQSGLQYMRNRYYDPRTGRFTQEDPIGLAGGLNLYGFAGGDPVNFSDPFGLSPADCCRYDGINTRRILADADRFAESSGRDKLVLAGAVIAFVGGIFGPEIGAALLPAAPFAGAVAPALKGRIPDAVPANFVQQIALNAARSGEGAQRIMGQMADAPRLIANYGSGEWTKMQTVVRGLEGNITVHWFRNLNTLQNVEYKFSHIAEAYK